MYFDGVKTRTEAGERSNWIWAIGGGKGGTGKSLVTANLGLTLARLGHRVCLVDADLGTANLHTFLGVTAPKKTLSDFIERRVGDIHDLVVKTDHYNLALVSGARDTVEVVNLKFVQKLKLFRHIQNMDFDFILIDLGAGTSLNVVDFFLVADMGILVTSPEPTAVENTYRFIKSLYYRIISRSIKKQIVKDMVDRALRERQEPQASNPHELLTDIESQAPGTATDVRQALAAFQLKLIVNQVRTADDFKLGRQIRSAVFKYFGLPLECAGSIVFDDKVWQSIRLMTPFVIQYPSAMAAQNVRAVCESLTVENGSVQGRLRRNLTSVKQRA